MGPNPHSTHYQCTAENDSEEDIFHTTRIMRRFGVPSKMVYNKGNRNVQLCREVSSAKLSTYCQPASHPWYV